MRNLLSKMNPRSRRSVDVITVDSNFSTAHDTTGIKDLTENGNAVLVRVQRKLSRKDSKEPRTSRRTSSESTEDDGFADVSSNRKAFRAIRRRKSRSWHKSGAATEDMEQSQVESRDSSTQGRKCSAQGRKSLSEVEFENLLSSVERNSSEESDSSNTSPRKIRRRPPVNEHDLVEFRNRRGAVSVRTHAHRCVRHGSVKERSEHVSLFGANKENNGYCPVADTCTNKNTRKDSVSSSVSSNISSSGDEQESIPGSRSPRSRFARMNVFRSSLRNKLPSLSESTIEPAKKFFHAAGGFHRRRKSREEKMLSSSETVDEIDESEICRDFQLDREVVKTDMLTDMGYTFSNNIWYYGQLEVVYGYRRNLCQSLSPSDYKGSIIARLDNTGNVLYSVTYKIGTKLHIGEVPMEAGKYCLDFSDSRQPRFSSAKYLIAYMIREGYLERVTFNWLIMNVMF